MGAVQAGLEGVVVAETVLSDVDGERGRLTIAGHDVEKLAGTKSFEDVAEMLLGKRHDIGRGRVEAFGLLGRLGDALKAPDGMDALRASIAHVNRDDEGLLIGAMGVFAAAWFRTQKGLAPIAPDPARGHAEDFLRMALGRDVGAASAKALDAYLVTVVDHGMNASTFAARVVASTQSDLVSSVVAALGALKGPLHGGAPGPVLDMLDAVGKPENAVAWLEGELAAGRRIMGMGHRIYRVRDPRAAVLEKQVELLEKAGVRTGRLPMARAVEHAAVGVLRQRHPNRPLAANVEFYTAVLLDSVGLDRTQFTPTFAMGRVVGWCAHVLEQRLTGRLIRPASIYVGAPAA